MAAGDQQEVEEESVEQKRALALARARARMQAAGSEEAAPKRFQSPAEFLGAREGRSLGESALRQVGRFARDVGPTAAGALAGGAAGSVLPGVGTALGAGAGAFAINLVKMLDQLQGTNNFQKLMDQMGLPKPEGSAEQLASAGVEGMVNMASGAGYAKGALEAGIQSPVGRGVAEAVARNPGMGAVSATSGGMAAENARQKGASPTEQLIANLLASAAPEVALGAARTIPAATKRAWQDTSAAVGAAFGNRESAKRLASTVMTELTRGNELEIKDALNNATTLVPGVKPNVAEAIAEANAKRGEGQIGGALVKLREQLSGAKGIEDIIPAQDRTQAQALKRYEEILNAATGQVRNRAIESSRRAGGPEALPVDLDLRLLRASPEIATNKIARRGLEDIQKQVQSVTRGGHVDPMQLYDIRRRLGDTIRRHYEAAGQPFDSKTAMALETQVRQSIDKAMTDGGAAGWRTYLNLFNQGKIRLEKHAARAEDARNIAKGVTPTPPKEIVEQHLIDIPHLLSRPTLLASFVLKLIKKDAITPVMREIAERLDDPKQAANLIRRPPDTTAGKEVNRTLINAAILSNLIKQHYEDNKPQEAE